MLEKSTVVMYNNEVVKRGTMIQFQSVTFRYDPLSRAALDDVTLTIREGSFVAIVGHNGSGKSTLAKHINGLLVPTEGTVQVLGMDTKDEANELAIRQNIGMVFQNPDNQLVTTVVEEDVAFGPENIGMDPIQIRQRVDEALERVGMTDFALRAVHTLSGGQKQRIAIAGILALSPRILVFDEASAMLDPKGRSELMQTMLDLKAKGLTVIMVTQYMEEITGCDRVVVMKHGKVIADDTPANILSMTELLKDCGLDVPESVRIRSGLEAMGIAFPKDALSVDAIVEVLCPLL